MRIESTKNYTFYNKEGDKFWVLDVKTRYSDCKRFAVILFPKSGYKVLISMNSILTRAVKDRRKRTILSIGYLGDNFEYIKTEDSQLCFHLYQIWKHMIYRCYNPSHKSHKSYYDKHIDVHTRWLNFSNFYYEVQKIPGYNRDLIISNKLSLDKDSRQADTDLRIYSLDTCCWLTSKEQQHYVDHYTPQKKVTLKIYHPDGKVTVEEGLHRISLKYHVDMKCMNRVLRGLQHDTKGYRFEYT